MAAQNKDEQEGALLLAGENKEFIIHQQPQYGSAANLTLTNQRQPTGNRWERSKQGNNEPLMSPLSLLFRPPHRAGWPTKGGKEVSPLGQALRALLLALAILAALLLSRFIYRHLLSHEQQQHQQRQQTHNNNREQPNFASSLRQVSIFSRHGDRAPSDSLPQNDRHRERVAFFWPNGLHNLTDVGKMRAFRMGLETRRHYHQLLDQNASSLLAFSSGVYRCRESMEFFLRGLYDLERPMAEGLTELANYGRCQREGPKDSCSQLLTQGSGSPLEWRRVRIDSETLATLSYHRLTNCAYRKQHPTPVDANLLNSAEIRRLQGINLLGDLVARRYGQALNFSCLYIFGIVLAETSVARTPETIAYTDHFSDWIGLEVSRRGDSVITLLDLYEQVAVLSQRDRIMGVAERIQSGTMLKSLIDGQRVALGDAGGLEEARAKLFQGKKVILYSSHDTILQRLLFSLGVMRTDGGTFEERFHRWQGRRQDELGMMLDGLKMSQYGMSIRFELWLLQSLAAASSPPPQLPVVRMSIYNQADAKHEPIVYQTIQFGSICRRRFFELHPRASEQELERDFYLATQFNNNPNTDCPFKLFRNLTADLLMDETELSQLCDH